MLSLPPSPESTEWGGTSHGIDVGAVGGVGASKRKRADKSTVDVDNDAAMDGCVLFVGGSGMSLVFVFLRVVFGVFPLAFLVSSVRVCSTQLSRRDADAIQTRITYLHICIPVRTRLHSCILCTLCVRECGGVGRAPVWALDVCAPIARGECQGASYAALAAHPQGSEVLPLPHPLPRCVLLCLRAQYK